MTPQKLEESQSDTDILLYSRISDLDFFQDPGSNASKILCYAMDLQNYLCKSKENPDVEFKKSQLIIPQEVLKLLNYMKNIWEPKTRGNISFMKYIPVSTHVIKTKIIYDQLTVEISYFGIHNNSTKKFKIYLISDNFKTKNDLLKLILRECPELVNVIDRDETRTTDAFHLTWQEGLSLPNMLYPSSKKQEVIDVEKGNPRVIQSCDIINDFSNVPFKEMFEIFRLDFFAGSPKHLSYRVLEEL